MKIVVVDDEIVVGKLIVRKTALWGYLGTVRIVLVPGDSAGCVAEQVLENEPPDVVVLDHDFKLEFSGANVAEELRRMGFNGRIVVFSSLLPETQTVLFASYEIWDYVTKPNTDGLRGPLGQIAQSLIIKAGD